MAVSRFIGVSHTIEPGMETYLGLSVPWAETIVGYDASHERYDNRSEFFGGALHLWGNTGTYVDAPMAGLWLESLADLSRPAHTILFGVNVPIRDWRISSIPRAASTPFP